MYIGKAPVIQVTRDGVYRLAGTTYYISETGIYHFLKQND